MKEKWKYSIIETPPKGKRIVRATMTFDKRIANSKFTMLKSMVKNWL